MARSKLPITYGFGRRDRVDPKLAPFGVLDVGQNLRVRKDGRLGMRNGYQPLDMTTADGTLVAYDLHEYRGRLCALGSDGGDGFPTDLFEYTGRADEPWRGTGVEQRVYLNPITNLREVAGLPQPEGGALSVDAAIGGGYVCLVYELSAGRAYAVIVDQVTDQTVHFEGLHGTGHAFEGGVDRFRVVYAGDSFYIAAVSLDLSEVMLARFTVGTDTLFAVFGSALSGSGDVAAVDICAVTNATTARLVVAYDAGDGTDVVTYNAAGATLGTATAAIVAVNISVEADQGDNTINLLTIEASSEYQARLRTYNFAGTLLDGPTVIGTGSTDLNENLTAYLCRLPAQTGFTEHVGVAVNTDGDDVEVYFVEVDTHTVTDSVVVRRAVCRSRLLSGQSANHPMAVLFSGLVGPDLATFERATNALFFVTPDIGHMPTRDYTRARDSGPVNLGRDAVTGKLCWVVLRDPGVDVAIPAVTLCDLQSSARRQSAQYGGLLYFAGSTPTVYDGRVNGELGFNELPGIVTVNAINGAGALSPNARYFYVFHWEYVLADGSVEQGPVTAPFEASTENNDDTMLVTVTGPHTVRGAGGDGQYGSNIIGVLSRTVWDPITSTAGSVFRRCAVRDMRISMVNYGRDILFTDLMSDAELATQGAIYTQAARGAFSGPLEHNAPRPCAYIAATEARLLTGGLSRECDVQISKAAFFGEPFAFSEASQFFSLASGPVIGVRCLDQQRLIFTSNTILSLTGAGPDDVGGNALEPPVEIPTASGLSNPWAFLEGPDGLWFQLDDTKLFKIPRGGGSPEWMGIDIEDTLLLYPDIVGAAKHRRDNAAIFAANTRAAEGVFPCQLLVYDFRTQNWFTDSPPVVTALGAICSAGDTVAFTANGVVYVQAELSFADAGGAFIPTTLRTRPLYPFGLGGYGQIYEMLVTGEVAGDCTLRTFVSYDDGSNFTELEPFDFVGLPAGVTFQRKFALPQDITSTLVVEFAVVASSDDAAATTSEGLIINQLDLMTEPEEGLRELSTAEQA